MKNFNTKYPEKSEINALKELGFESNFINKSLFNKCKKFKSNKVNKEIIDYFYEKLPFLIFLSLPILTLMFWLVYIRKKINYTEHLVFSYTFFTFMFICMIIFNIIDIINNNLAGIIAGFCFSIVFPIIFLQIFKKFLPTRSLENHFKICNFESIVRNIFIYFRSIDDVNRNSFILNYGNTNNKRH